MSSILKALKKLESEKAQRDELSTAVASDILRSSRQKRVKSLSLMITGVVVVCTLIAVVAWLAGIRVVAPEQTTTTVSTDDFRPATSNRPAAVAEKAEVRPAEGPQTVPMLALPELSGIIYQEDATSRLAIINDLPVMEGTLVEGFMVRAILPQKVVISRGGYDYDLFLPPD